MSENISKSNINLIINLIEQQDKKREIQINEIHRNVNEKYDCLDEKLEKIEKINEKILKETFPWRWISRNPKISAVIAGVFFLGILTLLIAFYKDQVESLVKTLISSA